MTIVKLADPQFDTPASEVDPNGSAVGVVQPKTRTLVVSHVAGMAETVSRSLARDETLDVSYRALSLEGLDQDPGFDPSGSDLIIFHVRGAVDADLAALRSIRAAAGNPIKFLGVTSEPLSLATARSLMDAGVDEVMPIAADRPTMDQAEAIGPAADEAIARRGEDIHDAMVLACIGARGGIGTTTYALNLATLLAHSNAKGAPAPKVAVVDLDFQNGVLGACLDISDRGAYLDLLRTGDLPDADFARTALTRYDAAGFDVLAAPVSFAPLGALTAPMVASLLDELRLQYDYVILDLPRALVDWIEPILNRADRFFILGDTSVHTVRQTKRMIDAYLGESASLPISLIISQEKRRMTNSAAVGEAENFLERPYTAWIPSDPAAAQKARDEGTTMGLAKPKSAAIKSMQSLTQDIVADLASTNRRRA